MKDLHRRGREACLQLLTGELIRHAVQVAIDLDVIVDIDPNSFPLCELIAFRRQRLQRRAIDLGKQTGATSVTLAKTPMIELLEEFGNGFVQLRDTEELTMPQRRNNPALGDQNRIFSLGLVPGL